MTHILLLCRCHDTKYTSCFLKTCKKWYYMYKQLKGHIAHQKFITRQVNNAQSILLFIPLRCSERIIPPRAVWSPSFQFQSPVNWTVQTSTSIRAISMIRTVRGEAASRFLPGPCQFRTQLMILSSLMFMQLVFIRGVVEKPYTHFHYDAHPKGDASNTLHLHVFCYL